MSDSHLFAFHLYALLNQHQPSAGLICSCGHRAPTPLGDPGLAAQTSDHMVAVDHCPDCWGTQAVSERATYDAKGTPMAGNLIDCPYCHGTGKLGDVTVGSVDRDAYYNRLQMLELATEHRLRYGRYAHL